MGSRALIVAGVLIGALYALGMIVRGQVVPGIVGGVLAAILARARAARGRGAPAPAPLADVGPRESGIRMGCAGPSTFV